MKKYKIYFYTTVGFAIIYAVLITFFVIPTIIKFGITSQLQNEINSAKKETQQLAILSGEALSQNLKKESILTTIQKVITGSENENIFLSVFDWSGKTVSYPDVTKIGEKDMHKSNTISNIESVITGSELYQLLFKTKKEQNALIDSEIIMIKPIPNSDWIIAAHLNIKNTKLQEDGFKKQLQMVCLVLGLALLLFILGIIRIASSYYETIIEQKTATLEDGVLNLSKLNTSLETYQKSFTELKEIKRDTTIQNTDESESKELPKQRLLTYIRNELRPIAVEEISYIYLENSITYVVRKDGKKLTASESLDQIYYSLDEKLFFRANRQIIVAIYAIDKIIKYGNSALKIEMKPVSETDIVIGKNKTSAFKQWLDR
ncbi:LytTR family DNA-binding domain-containing protein [Aquimarina sp. RZ0]|uniref:LytR/AlgR family response regulator transcription factor n=1 Tax=Aquimarina sp. RZ0 TaxID=2607730 RepID=UPI0011F2B5DF|nr:LytTR family DNA-binding domain-containing protein [Aquimarina sp. RZ0]KAA1247193.1 LytTR family transcriptional regulator [Aquimarina sp. RZ0]